MQLEDTNKEKIYLNLKIHNIYKRVPVYHVHCMRTKLDLGAVLVYDEVLCDLQVRSMRGRMSTVGNCFHMVTLSGFRVLIS